MRFLLVGVALLASGIAQAQLGKATEEEIKRSGNGPGPVPGGSPGNPLPAITDRPPSVDARNFAGTWRTPRMAAGGARAGGGPPGGAAPVAGGAPRGGAPAAGAPGATGGAGGALPDRILCLPSAGTTVGGDGPLLIVQTPEQITWAAEEMHVIRRIYLQGEFTPGFKPNYIGEAIGHFEDNTLVIETRGLRNLAPGAKMIERWRKSADGKTLEMSIGNVDAEGRAIGNARTQSITWRPGEEVFEWMCEDYNDEWLPGGSDFEDQVNK
jgi:hypothetical protein